MKKVAVLNLNQFYKGGELTGFYANTLQNHLATHHKDIIVPHSHNFYLAILFTHGSGTHEIDFTTYEVKPGSLFFLNPGQTHHWELSDDVEGFIFFHTLEFYNLQYNHKKITDYPFFYSMHSLPCLYPDITNTVSFTNMFREITAEYNRQDILQEQKLLTLADLVYIESTRLYASGNSDVSLNRNSYYVRFRKLEDLVDKNYKYEKSPSAYAAMLNMSLKHLNRITRDVAGKAAGDIITERVLLEAKRLLVLQKHSFNEIATELGYEDYAYFSRLFKTKTGETPTGFVGKYR